MYRNAEWTCNCRKHDEFARPRCERWLRPVKPLSSRIALFLFGRWI